MLCLELQGRLWDIFIIHLGGAGSGAREALAPTDIWLAPEVTFPPSCKCCNIPNSKKEHIFLLYQI